MSSGFPNQIDRPHIKVTGLHLVSPNLAVSLGVDFRLAVWKVIILFSPMLNVFDVFAG